jgi:hypothetical protein
VALVSSQILFLDLIELEARLEQMERCIHVLREPLKDMGETIAGLRSEKEKPASSSAKRRAERPAAGSEV